MRRAVFPVLGLLELGAAAALVALAWSLPGAGEVRLGFEGARLVSAAAHDQVRIARREVEGLRRAGLSDRADRLAGSLETMGEVAARSRVDFETIAAMRDGLVRAADGLETLAGAVDPEGLGRLDADLLAAADVIDRRIVPAAVDAADRIEAASGPMGQGARQLADALAASPLDLAPLREMRDGIARLDEGLAATDAMLDPDRLATIGDAAGGAEGVVDEAARLADRASGYSYPVVELDGLTPRVRQRPFWPGGRQVGSDLRRVSAGMEAIESQAEALARELPTLRASLAEGRRGLASTREALDLALARQEEIDRLLDELPARAAELSGALPRLADDLSGALREASRLSDLAASLREARQSVHQAREHWPGVRSGLMGAAGVLRASGEQADRAIRDREAYESALSEFSDLSGAVATGLPGLADRLDEQEHALEAMAVGIGQLDATLPAYERALVRCVAIGRWLAGLVAGIAALHGAWMVAQVRRGVVGGSA